MCATSARRMCSPQRCGALLGCSSVSSAAAQMNSLLLVFTGVQCLLTCKRAWVQVPSAKGRMLVSHGSTFSTRFLSEVLSKRFPQFKFPAGEDTPSKEVLSSAKARPCLGLLVEWCPGNS